MPIRGSVQARCGVSAKECVCYSRLRTSDGMALQVKVRGSPGGCPRPRSFAGWSCDGGELPGQGAWPSSFKDAKGTPQACCCVSFPGLILPRAAKLSAGGRPPATPSVWVLRLQPHGGHNSTPRVLGLQCPWGTCLQAGLGEPPRQLQDMKPCPCL